MRAAVLRNPGAHPDITLDDLAAPTPTDSQVLIEVAACGVCGHDQADRHGLTPVETPVILGHEISGTVVEVGSRVRGFDVGDRIATKQTSTCGICVPCRTGRERECALRSFNYGGWAEFVAVEATAVLRVPDTIDLPTASIIACAIGSTLQALDRAAGVRAGEWVTVTGASGGLGRHALKVARALGAKTLALTGSAGKAADLAGSDADAVVVTEGKDYWKEITELTGGGSPVIIDTVGVPEVFNACFRALANGGRYVFMGQIEHRRSEFFPAFVFRKQAVITGAGLTLLESFARAMDLVASGDVVPAVHRYALTDVASALRDNDQRTLVGRAILAP